MSKLILPGLLLLAGTSVLAEPLSGPAVGAVVPELTVRVATGPQEGKVVPYVKERAEKPTVYVLIREWDRPTARYLKTLDTALKAEAPGTEAVAVWLSADKEKLKNYLPLAQQSLKFEATILAVVDGDPIGPEEWMLHGDAHVTTVVATKGKVTARFAYISLNETDVPAVKEAVKKALPGK